MSEYEVVWPLGRIEQAAFEAADRPGDLDGKRVGFVWDYVFRGDQMFDVIKRELRERFPTVEFVDYENFGNVHGRNESEVVAALPHRLAQQRVDAAIVGVGA